MNSQHLVSPARLVGSVYFFKACEHVDGYGHYDELKAGKHLPEGMLAGKET